MKSISSSKLIFLVAVFLIAFGNLAFFSNVTAVYPVNIKNIFFLISLVIVFCCFIIILLSLVCNKYTIKPILIIILMISSSASYFMDTYNVIIDSVMIDNIIKTDTGESIDLLSTKLLLYLVFLGLLPSVLIYKANITFGPLKKDIISRLKLLFFSIILAASTIMIFGDYYASFFREHKTLRYYSNPSFYIYSSAKYIGSYYKTELAPFKPIGLDAMIPPTDTHKELVIFVVGEAARFERFALNGYHRDTNPRLKNEDIISFTNFWACGTSTAVSVPCMFSIYGSSAYSQEKAQSSANVLDILQHAGVNVIWLDNNSDSKGVALRVPYKSYKTSDENSTCDIECRDEGMLSNLQAYIDNHPQGDIFIVLHQMGNHGPAYYKRYPKEFEKFTPTCETNQLESCTSEEISNTYDNAILYTDYFLAKTIALLKKNNDQFESSLIYVSDHGESLGESGIYLHGLPNMLAPDVQKHIPVLMWFSDSFNFKDEINYSALQNKTDIRYSHDNIFHTILGLLEIKTNVYDISMDIIDHKDED